MPKRAKPGRRPPVRGLSVERRDGAKGDVFISRSATAEMSFTDLAHEHLLPTYADASPITRKNLESHLGDGTGQPARAGAKNARAAWFARERTARNQHSQPYVEDRSSSRPTPSC